jgi:SAM-dependent methyltransferase
VRCNSCGLVFVPEEFHVTEQEEKYRYSKHTNVRGDTKYTAYLSRIADDILSLPVQSPAVLDFGSGHDQVLAYVLQARGVACVSHDPMYGLDAAGADRRFDIIVACEVFEHLRDIRKEIRCIARLVKTGGFVYVHTLLYNNVQDLASWWYIKDVTHINFFCEKTLGIVAEMTGMKIRSTNKKDTVVLESNRIKKAPQKAPFLSINNIN